MFFLKLINNSCSENLISLHRFRQVHVCWYPLNIQIKTHSTSSKTDQDTDQEIWILEASSKPCASFFIYYFKLIERFHSRDKLPYWFTQTKDGFYIKIEFNSLRTSLVHQYGRCDLTWKRSMVSPLFTSEIQKWHFFWGHNIISLTKSSLACKINDKSNKGNLSFLSVPQWLATSTGSSPLTLLWIQVSSKEKDYWQKHLKLQKLGQIKEANLNPSHHPACPYMTSNPFSLAKALVNYFMVDAFTIAVRLLWFSSWPWISSCSSSLLPALVTRHTNLAAS